jgi:hypothetical protein
MHGVQVVCGDVVLPRDGEVICFGWIERREKYCRIDRSCFFPT